LQQKVEFSCSSFPNVEEDVFLNFKPSKVFFGQDVVEISIFQVSLSWKFRVNWVSQHLKIRRVALFGAENDPCNVLLVSRLRWPIRFHAESAAESYSG
jgi:hypothetical protein